MIDVLFAGDYCDTCRVDSLISKGNFSDLFDGVKPIVESADISVVNFEFPVVRTEGCPIPKFGPAIKGQPAAVDAIKYAGFKVCALANNHIMDQGTDCCLDTRRLLEEAGIRTVGVGSNGEDASGILYMEHDGECLAIINCCEHEFSTASFDSAGANPIDPVSQYYKIQEARLEADFVVVVAHGGCEHYQLPSPRMKKIYRFFIDAGADAVINHHQHCFSGYEQYKERPIFYGLGNLLFDRDRRRNSPWNKGYMVELKLSRGAVTEFELYPYTQCDDEPGIKMLDEDGKKPFREEIDALNEVIASDEKLGRAFAVRMEKSAKQMELLFQPYNGRLTKGLYVRNLLPSFVGREKKYKIIDYLSCESHIEDVLFALNNMK